MPIPNRILTKCVTKCYALAALGISAVFAPPALAARPQAVRPEVVAAFPHDPQAFTQGLLFHQGKLYESTGLLGRSSLRRVVPSTGAVEKSVSLASNLFAEGLALVGDRFFQLTWQNHVALTYDLDFNAVGRFDYTGEGWGLCYDGARLVMSDGSSRLLFRNPTTFAVTGEVEVRNANGPVSNLNELECVGSLVYANVWQTNTIVRVDPGSGDVLHTIDASGLLTPAEAAGVDVLNGIAFDPGTGHFFITGKLWPKLFEVRLSFPGPDSGTTGGAGGRANAGGSGGTTSGGAGVASSGTAGATGGSTNASGASNEPEPPVSKESRSRNGCGCASPGNPRPEPLKALLVAIGAVLLTRRRRPARKTA